MLYNYYRNFASRYEVYLRIWSGKIWSVIGGKRWLWICGVCGLILESWVFGRLKTGNHNSRNCICLICRQNEQIREKIHWELDIFIVVNEVEINQHLQDYKTVTDRTDILRLLLATHSFIVIMMSRKNSIWYDELSPTSASIIRTLR